MPIGTEKRVVIISGVAGSGKSRFVRELFEGQWPEIAERLEIDVDRPRAICDSASLDRVLDRHERILLEHGILRPEAPDWGSHVALASTRRADRLTVGVVWCEPGELARRTRRRIWKTLFRVPRPSSRRRGTARREGAVLQRITAARARPLGKRVRALVRNGLLLHASLAAVYKRYPRLIEDLHRRWVDWATCFGDPPVWIVDVTDPSPRLIQADVWLHGRQ